jgi:hypothetical protein
MHGLLPGVKITVAEAGPAPTNAKIPMTVINALRIDTSYSKILRAKGCKTDASPITN